MKKNVQTAQQEQSIFRKILRVVLVLLVLTGIWFALHYVLLFVFDRINGVNRDPAAGSTSDAGVRLPLPSGDSIGGTTEVFSGSSVIRREIAILPYSPKQALAMQIRLWQAKGAKILENQNFELKRNIPYPHEVLLMPDKSLVFLKAESAPEGCRISTIQCRNLADSVPETNAESMPLDKNLLEMCSAESARLCLGDIVFLVTRGTGDLKSWTFSSRTEKEPAAVQLELQSLALRHGWAEHIQMKEALQLIREGKGEYREDIPSVLLYRKADYQCVITLTGTDAGSIIHYKVSKINNQIWNEQGEESHE